LQRFSKAEIADIVRQHGLDLALAKILPEQIDDGELYRWWAKAQTAIREISLLVANCQGKRGV
jgi:hypothetical protein